jgi:hypothetical protein
MRSIGETISSKIQTFYKGPQNISKTQAQKLMELEKEERLRDKVDTNVFYSENSGAAECFEYLTKHRSIFVATSTGDQIREIKDPQELDTIETKQELSEKEKKNLDILFDTNEEVISKVSPKILQRLSREGRVKASDDSQNERGLCFDNAQFNLLDNKPVFIARTGTKSSPAQEVRNMKSLFLITEDKEKVEPSKIENWNISGIPQKKEEKVEIPSSVKLEDLNDAFFEKLDAYYDQNFYYPTLDFGYLEEGQNKDADDMINKILAQGNIVAVEGRMLYEYGYSEDNYEPYSQDIKVLVDGKYYEKPPEVVEVTVPLDEKDRVKIPSTVKLEDLNDAFFKKLDTYYDQNFYYPTLDFGYIEPGENKDADDMIDKLVKKGNIVAVEGRAISEHGYGEEDYEPYSQDIKVLVDGKYYEKPPEVVEVTVPLDEKDRVTIPSTVKLEDLNDAFFEKLDTYHDQNGYYPTLDFGYIEDGQNKDADNMIDKILAQGNIVAVDGRMLYEYGYSEDDYEPYSEDIKVIVDGKYYEKPPEG